MVAVADTEDGIAAVCNLAKRPRSIYTYIIYLQKVMVADPKGAGYGARAPPKFATGLCWLVITFVELVREQNSSWADQRDPTHN
jgi:hypothetical protein